MTTTGKPAKATADKKAKKDKPKPIPLSERIDDPEILEVLRQPIGSPINLTPEQALVVLRAGVGSRPDLPPGDQFVNELRKTLGIRLRG